METNLIPPTITEFKVQVGRYKGSYSAVWTFWLESQAYMYYNGLNMGNGYKKRLLKDGKVIERFIS